MQYCLTKIPFCGIIYVFFFQIINYFIGLHICKRTLWERLCLESVTLHIAVFDCAYLVFFVFWETHEKQE